MAEKKTREMLSSRLGFLLLSAGCAIGLGNVWRFPYITGNYGGAIFVGIFLICLLAVMPIMIMEFAVGRAARRNMGLAFGRLEPEGTHWHRFGWWALVGSYVLMMFYTVVTGWMLLYCWYTASGALSGLQPAQVGAFFGEVLGSAGTLVVLIGSGICAMGVQKGVERVVKLMMVGLVLILLVLVVRALLLPGAMEGVRFYLVPDVDRFLEKGVFNVISAAMNQSFFCLSVGIGAMTIFGSYQSKERALTGEALWITLFNTLVGIFAGLIIFPACFSFGVSPNSGPGLVFVTLPNIFNNMFLGRLWGTLFFILMAFAALSTVIAVFENIIWGMPRRRAVVLHLIGLWVLSLPCALGFNVWSDFQPFGAGTSVLDLEDFIISNHMLPLGGLFFLLFCCIRYGWGWDKFIAETDTGEGMKFPAWLRPYLTYILPLVILFLFVMGYVDRFGGK